jgi:hypothetical protein
MKPIGCEEEAGEEEVVAYDASPLALDLMVAGGRGAAARALERVRSAVWNFCGFGGADGTRGKWGWLGKEKGEVCSSGRVPRGVGVGCGVHSGPRNWASLHDLKPN